MGIDPVATARRLASEPIDAADTDRCALLLDTSRRMRCWLDALDASITNRHNELRTLAAAASQPVAPPVEDVVSKHCGVSAAEGRKRGRRGNTITDAPLFGDALASGDVVAEHIDALGTVTDQLDDQTKAAFLEREAELLAQATNTTPAQFGRKCRDLARSLERKAGIERNKQQRRDTFLSHRINPETGMHEGRFAFHPELGNQIFNAIQHEVSALVAAGNDRGVDRQQLAAVALGNLVTGGHHATRALEADITVIIDATTLTTGELHEHSVCETTDGAVLPPASILRLLCNGSITPVITGADGVPINVGRTRRQATRAQRRALRSMYRTCAFKGCEIGFERCEIHHIVPWETSSHPVHAARRLTSHRSSHAPVRVVCFSTVRNDSTKAVRVNRGVAVRAVLIGRRECRLSPRVRHLRRAGRRAGSGCETDIATVRAPAHPVCAPSTPPSVPNPWPRRC
ncbi:MAG TPA: DUF222 domain-containing protein [Ilumatobacter sp.]|nr:DUF222 domain-containing protein [Ilumatobacter sp.]